MRSWFRLLAIVAWVCTPAAADLVRLQNGGEVRGKLRPGHTRDPEVTIDTLSGGIVVVPRDQVAFTIVRSVDVEDYELRAKRIEPTVAARWELAEWCRERRLRPQRIEQLEHLLLLDPGHVEARKALGHVQERGEWMTVDEQMALRGYTRRQGRWVTQQELDLLEMNDALRAAEKEWFSKVHAWTRWVAGTAERQRAQGLAELRAIVDPAAVAALSTHLGDHDQSSLRALFVEVLGNIPGPRAVKPLVDRSLFDRDATVRTAAFDALKPDQYGTAVPLYAQALLNADNQVVNRAAGGLSRFGDARIVPALIDALVTSHRYEVKVPVNTPLNFALPNGAGSVDPRALSPYLPADVDVALRSGQFPAGVVVLPPVGGQPQRFRVVKVQAQLSNAEVLAALRKFTKQDFGFDERTWKLWWAAEGSKLLAAA